MPLPYVPTPARLHRRCGAALLLAISGTAAAQPTFTGLGDLPGGQFYSEAWGVSADGSAVVGGSIINGNVLFGGTFAAFRWTAATGMVDIYDVGGIGTVCKAYAASPDGNMVVGVAAYGTLSSYSAAFIWRPEVGAVEIGDIDGGAVNGAARGLSANGLFIAGQGQSDLGTEGWRYDVTQSTFQGVGSLGGTPFTSNAYGISGDGLTVVGSSVTNNGTIAFRWTQAGGMVSIGSLPVPDGVTPFSEAYTASADGSVIAGLSRSMVSGGNGWEAFRWTAATGMVDIGDLDGGGVLAQANAMTPDGSTIVGTGGVQGNCSPFGCQTLGHAFIWDAQRGMRDLNDVLPAMGLNLNGWVLNQATGISADGRVIVGTGTDPQTNTQAWRVDLGGPPPCYANCDGSTSTPVLNVADFTCFLQKYAQGNPYANCDGSTTIPTLNVADFTCFLQKFAQGCP
jgi:uncharacterized membrane protein